MKVNKLIRTFLPLLVLNSASFSFAKEAEFSYSGKYFSFKPGGKIELDSARASNGESNADHVEYANAIKLNFKGFLFSKKLEYKTEFDFSSDEPAMKKMYVDYMFNNKTKIRFGRNSYDFGLDREGGTFTDSIDNAFLIPKAMDGVQLLHYGQNYTAVTGFVTSRFEKDDKSAKQRVRSLFARLTYNPIYNKDLGKILHFGISSSMQRKPSGHSHSFSYKPNGKLSKMSLLSASVPNLKDFNTTAVDFAFAYKNFLVVSELYHSKFSQRKVGDKEPINPIVNAGYIELDWVPTGEYREYSNGSLKAIKPKSPVNFKNFNPKELGAFEFNAKYSTINLNQKNWNKGRVKIYGLGLNWYLTDKLKLVNDYLTIKTDRNAATPNSTTKAFITRLSYCF